MSGKIRPDRSPFDSFAELATMALTGSVLEFPTIFSAELFHLALRRVLKNSCQQNIFYCDATSPTLLISSRFSINFFVSQFGNDSRINPFLNFSDFSKGSRTLRGDE